MPKTPIFIFRKGDALEKLTKKQIGELKLKFLYLKG